MSISQMLLPEFDQEMATTRGLLAVVPEGNPEWRPHAKSTTLGALAVHIAMLASLAESAIHEQERDFNPPGGRPFAPPTFTTTAKLLELFDANVARGRAAIEGASDKALLEEQWSLKTGGHTIFTLPRVAVLRTMVVNHIIHHRGQLSVYLRLNDVALPSIYGPTADM